MIRTMNDVPRDILVAVFTCYLQGICPLSIQRSQIDVGISLKSLDRKTNTSQIGGNSRDTAPCIICCRQGSG